MDPRHLEHFSYPLWATEAAHIIAMSGFNDLMVGPQFPMWTSAVEERRPILDDLDISGRTTADGSARGVAVDIAVFLPLVRPRFLNFFRLHVVRLKALTLWLFMSKVLNRNARLPAFAARCLWTDELWAPILMELKVPPSRHPETLAKYYSHTVVLLTDAQDQSLEQGICLFCSWRFVHQMLVFLIAISGDIWSICRLTRAAAATYYPDKNVHFNPTLLLNMKFREEEEEASTVSVEDHNLMYTHPLTVAENRSKLRQRDRAARAQQRRNRKAAPPPASGPAPNYDDYGLPLFSDEALDEYARSQGKGDGFWETRLPKEFFAGDEATEWSLSLRLGTPMSDKYKGYLSDYLTEENEKEQDRRRNVYFERFANPDNSEDAVDSEDAGDSEDSEDEVDP
ncbi:hypothetical protein AURDEDRAFT_149110 [Auricularia subglabra TFB-10046 SS5]|nr:hypothetical protein AURDEDRAFT_149110 [Auricularia subglabra TFB-10046 SS5]